MWRWLEQVLRWLNRVLRWLNQVLRWLNRLLRRPQPIPDALWQRTLGHYPFLTALCQADQHKLRLLSAQFLARKQFSGTHNLVVTDDMAVAIAAQACLPVLHLAKGEGLAWYDDFEGIVVHPGAMLAQRSETDAAGVVHYYREPLIGEAMQGGPVTLSWADVAESGQSADRGHNVVIHEFVHKIDMRTGSANGCPPLPSRAAREHWQATMQAAFDAFKEQVVMAERFGAEQPWLDAYGATAPAEFFAVAAEGYFVNRKRFELEFLALAQLFDSFFYAGKNYKRLA